MAEMLAHDLGEFSRLRVLDRAAAGDLIQERSFADSKSASQSTANAEKTAAEYLVTGTSTVREAKLSIKARLTQVGESKPIQTWSHEGTVDEFMKFQAALVGEVADALKVKSLRQKGTVPQSTDASPTLAILNLENYSADANLDVMEVGFADLLQASLGANSNVRLVDRKNISNIIAEQQLSNSGLMDPQSAIQFGKLLQADRLLIGSFIEIGKDLGIQARLVDTTTGAIVASEKVSGPRQEFSGLLDDLTLNILSDLATPTSREELTRMRPVPQARSMESAVHLATGNRLMSGGLQSQAAEALQRYLLLEPDNMACYESLITIQWRLNQFEDAERTAKQALSRESKRGMVNSRERIAWMLAHTYQRLKRYPELFQTTEILLNEFKIRQPEINKFRANALVELDRYDEALKIMESAVGEPDPDYDWENKDLKNLFLFHVFRRNDVAAPAALRDPEITKASCRKALEIFERILVSAAGKTDQDAQEWASMIVPHMANLSYTSKEGFPTAFFSNAECADMMRRALEVFDWNPMARGEGNLVLGTNAELAELWGLAVQGYQNYLQACPGMEGFLGSHQSSIPSLLDSGEYAPTTWIDKKIEIRYRLARVNQEGLKKLEVASQEYRSMVSTVGLTNFCGFDAVNGMTKLELKPEYPEKCALVWGWESTGQRSWERLLGPRGFTVHSQRVQNVTAAHLAPYSLVILVHSGTNLYTPTEILALRSYVASGGALLAIVTPGWEPASPSIHRSLLKFFDIEIGDPLGATAEATQLIPHSITEGVTLPIAKTPVSLSGPSESILVSSEGKGLLAAREYRHGRIVVATFGQWLIPDMSIFPSEWQRQWGSHWTVDAPISALPIGDESELCQPLLNNTLAWLEVMPERSAEFTNWKKELADFHWTALRVQSRSLDWSALRPATEKLIALAKDSSVLEESLWIAGEAYFSPRCSPEYRHPFTDSSFSYQPDEDQAPEPKHYLKLLELYPESPLRDFAQWRVAECDRLIAKYQIGHSEYSSERDAAKFQKSIEAYDRVSAPVGAIAWAWSRLRQAAMKIEMGDIEGATALTRQVMESMPNGPERTFALALAGSCLAKSGHTAESRRIYLELKSIPKISWMGIHNSPEAWNLITSYMTQSDWVSNEGITNLDMK